MIEEDVNACELNTGKNEGVSEAVSGFSEQSVKLTT